MQFTVVATRHLAANEFIFDAPGILSTDASDGHDHSELSQLRPHESQESSLVDMEDRLFIGPIRFLNHRCIDWNTSVSLICLLRPSWTDTIN